MTDLNDADTTALVVTNSVLEGEDLLEILETQGIGPARHVRDFETALREIACSGDRLKLLIFGLNTRADEAAVLLAAVDPAKTALLLIDDSPHLSSSDGAGFVARPFTTEDVIAALTQVCLST
ncbi:hypothetical protein [Marivita sp. S2033]|uniref:hypothetical protein n=1 Tax=Marivita sp. S2033 TaxID=3373187 RepID=UPI003982CA76